MPNVVICPLYKLSRIRVPCPRSPPKIFSGDRSRPG